MLSFLVVYCLVLSSYRSFVLINVTTNDSGKAWVQNMINGGLTVIMIIIIHRCPRFENREQIKKNPNPIYPRIPWLMGVTDPYYGIEYLISKT